MDTQTRKIYGLKIESGPYRRRRDLIGYLDTSPAGNIIIATGEELRTGGWRKTGHIVLTRSEARELAIELLERVGDAGETTLQRESRHDAQSAAARDLP